MSKSTAFVLGAMITGPLAFVMFSDTHTPTRVLVSVVLAAGVGTAAALMFGSSRNA